jgi:hypothetical protein
MRDNYEGSQYEYKIKGLFGFENNELHLGR